MRSTRFQLFILTVGFGLVGCSGSSGGTSGTGGQQGVGGATDGGMASSGGAPVNTGGATSAGPTGGVNAGPTGGVNAGPTGGVNAGPTGGVNAGPTGGVNAGPTGGVNAGPTGGVNAGPTGGKSATGGTNNGSPTGGVGTTGGKSATGGTNSGNPTGGNAPTGGTLATGGTTSTGTVTGPCDIYAAASPATPCVAAYSTTRLLNSAYTGPLYQVRKGGSASGTGGTLTDIGTIAGGFADGAAQDTACGTTGACTISILYDQSGRGNNLKVAPAGCYTGTASEPDFESNAKGKSITISGHKVYALYTIAHDGYRNNAASGMPTGTAAQGIYEIADGSRTPVGSACCWDFGNASTDNCYNGGTSTMNAMYFGTGYWGKGTGNGPWFLGDFEAGVWAGGTGASTVANTNLPSSNVPFAFGILKTNATNYAIRVGNAASGTLTTAYDGALPFATWHEKGGIILGIGGDNSNSSLGTFFEGAITAGRPSDATDAAVLANVQAAKYGQ